MQATRSLEKNNEALKRQLENSSKFAQMQLDEASKKEPVKAVEAKVGITPSFDTIVHPLLHVELMLHPYL
jgi:hypothetical protein